MQQLKTFVLIGLMLLASSAWALERVQVLALFPGKAMLQLDGTRKVLSVGQSHAGLTLLSANPREATVDLNGEMRVLKLGSAVSASYAQSAGREIRVLGDGHSFYLNGLINGHPMRMLIDTGATSMALSEQHAKALGLQYVDSSRRIRVSTASGAAFGYAVTLKSIKLGEHVFQNVRAMVIEGDSPTHVLLGMNVLREFKIEQQRNLMILRSRY